MSEPATGDETADAGTASGRPTRVAIACQGGGSHTAFTAGVLRRLLAECDWGSEYELVGISGTSGGAFNALATWYGLVTGDEATAIDLLDAIWNDVAATGWTDRWANEWIATVSRVQSMGVPVPEVSPYQSPGGKAGQDRLAAILERHVDFDAIPDLCERTAPKLVVGTVDVEGGVFETFVDEEVTAAAVLASAAVPDLFPAVEVHGHGHWDGLFSQNPPVDDLTTAGGGRKPDELWVIQINEQEREGTPTTVEEITDRRNELSGNISLNQELRFIERVNDWIEEGHLPESDFTHIEVRRLEMGRSYHCSTKLDRSPAFLRELIELGEKRATAFLNGEA